MKVTEFARRIAKKEKGKREVNIAQILEILKVIRGLLKGVDFYQLIRKVK